MALSSTRWRMQMIDGIRKLDRAWYSASIAEFVAADANAIVGQLTLKSGFAIVTEQSAAWSDEITLLKAQLAGISGAIYLEFTIPRMGRRIDAVVISGPVVFAIEFKVGSKEFDRAAVNQVWDYALDLKNFHEGSHKVRVVPILVATEATTSPSVGLEYAADDVARPIRVTPKKIRAAIESSLSGVSASFINDRDWYESTYKPTPTIVEAARALYARHSVEEIARHDAGAVNLRITSKRIEELVDDARTNGRKIICFVTGVPGAGKTLVGLNVATQRRDTGQTHAVFLSGNGPLVAVLREALTRDALAAAKSEGRKTTKAREAEPVKAFIQNVHHFFNEALMTSTAPADRVVIFDEAQRAWNKEKLSSFMKRKKGRPYFEYSEPAFLISYMDRHRDWAVIVCLVGGGQEIHTGEGGISAWLDAAAESFSHWDIYVSSRLTDSEYAAGDALNLVRSKPNAYLEPNLHLAASMRSFRAENVSAFVKATLDFDASRAKELLGQIQDKYPIVMTRDLETARNWLRSKARGSERVGLVASSKAMRMKPHAIDIRVAIDPVHWFLGESDDIRSSSFLEDCATEFQVQGLELDWACVCWDADMRVGEFGWSYHDFRANRWEAVRAPERQAYLRNSYRVLLTRARQGMVVFVPPGSPKDETRKPVNYEALNNYLRVLGVLSLDEISKES